MLKRLQFFCNNNNNNNVPCIAYAMHRWCHKFSESLVAGSCILYRQRSIQRNCGFRKVEHTEEFGHYLPLTVRHAGLCDSHWLMTNVLKSRLLRLTDSVIIAFLEGNIPQMFISQRTTDTQKWQFQYGNQNRKYVISVSGNNNVQHRNCNGRFSTTASSKKLMAGRLILRSIQEW